MKNLLTIIVAAILTFVASISHAQTSNLSIQGIVKSIEGNAIENGNYNITFKLYDVAVAGTVLWEETIEDVRINGGIYSVVLGAAATPLDVPFNVPYYLGVSVDGDVDLYPRARLTSSPYALSLIGDDNIFPNSGNVGVGSDDPQSKLTVGNEAGTLGFDVEDNITNNATISTKSDGIEFSTEGATNGYYFIGEMTEVMRIKKDGKVNIDGQLGIGVSDPQNTLHVVGDNEQVKIEGTDNANMVFTKTTGSATLGFDAANGDTMLLSNPLGATKIEGNNITLNPSSGITTIEGNTAIDGTLEITKEGEAIQLVGSSNTQLAFYPTEIAGGKKADIGVASNGQFWVNSSNSDIVLSPGSGERVQTTGMLYATGYESVHVSQSNHIWERYTSASYAARQNARNYNLSIYASYGIRAHEYVIASDQRIKKDFSLSNGQEDLSTLAKIEVTDYRHINEPANGKEIRKGLIAQQVESVFPEAIKKGTDFIPNVFEMPVALSLENGRLKVRLSKNHDFEIGDKIRIDTNSGDQDVIVASIISPYEFSIDNWQGTDNKKELFIYGKEVNDFHTVDYDRIFTLNVSATQELARQVATLQKENAELKHKASKTDDLLKSLSAKVDALEQNLQMTGSK